MYIELATDEYYDKLYSELVKHGLNLIQGHDKKGAWYRYQSFVFMFSAEGLLTVADNNLTDLDTFGYDNEDELYEEWDDVRKSFMDDKLSFDDMYDKYCKVLYLSHPWFYLFLSDCIESEKHALKLQKDIKSK